MKLRLRMLGLFALAALLAAGVLAPLAVQAQQKAKIAVEGGTPDDRGSTRLLYWNETADAAAGQFEISYGRPLWKSDYEDPAKFDGMTKGKVWRMGSNFWSVLSTDLPLSISGHAIKPGAYYLGLARSADGHQWSLAFIDIPTVRKMHLDAFDIRKAPIEFKVPMTSENAGSKVDKLTLTLTHPNDDITNAKLTVAWGTLALSAPVKVTLPE